MLSFFARILSRFEPAQERKFIVSASRYSLPVNKAPVFGTFVISASSAYEAARLFDTTHTAWRRQAISEA